MARHRDAGQRDVCRKVTKVWFLGDGLQKARTRHSSVMQVVLVAVITKKQKKQTNKQKSTCYTYIYIYIYIYILFTR